jgi:hypothetical protein
MLTRSRAKFHPFVVASCGHLRPQPAPHKEEIQDYIGGLWSAKTPLDWGLAFLGFCFSLAEEGRKTAVDMARTTNAYRG